MEKITALYISYSRGARAQLTKDRNDEEYAIITFRTLNRLMFTESRGRPKYPEFSWKTTKTFVEVYKNESYIMKALQGARINKYGT